MSGSLFGADGHSTHICPQVRASTRRCCHRSSSNERSHELITVIQKALFMSLDARSLITEGFDEMSVHLATDLGFSFVEISSSRSG